MLDSIRSSINFLNVCRRLSLSVPRPRWLAMSLTSAQMDLLRCDLQRYVAANLQGYLAPATRAKVRYTVGLDTENNSARSLIE